MNLDAEIAVFSQPIGSVQVGRPSRPSVGEVRTWRPTFARASSGRSTRIRALADALGKAEITSDPAVPRQTVEDYPKRYLMARLGLHRPTEEMFDKVQILPIAITPVRDLPEGFASNPGTPAPSIDGGQQRS